MVRIILYPIVRRQACFSHFQLVILILDQSSDSTMSKLYQAIRGFIEAFALITSFKYGIWAVTMIWAGAWQGVQKLDGMDGC